MSDGQVKYLEMIQAVISRMASNAFLLKAWTVTLVVAVLGVATSTKRGEVALVALLPLAAFWGLDGFYLSCERRFRRLFDHARTSPPDAVDFSLDPSAFAETDGCNWRDAATSQAVLVFYVPLTLLCIIASVLLFAG